MKQVYLTIALLIASITAFAQVPSGYYNSATGTGYTLKEQLKNIIDNNSDGLTPEYQSTDPGYSALYETYKTSDADNYYENNGTVLDMYTENPSGTDVKEYDHDTDRDPGSGGSAEGQFFNREHIIPQSFFSQSTPERSDAHFVVPSDKYVNNQRGSFPFGVVQTPNATYTNGSKRGNNLNSGYSAGYTSTVFEPIDEFKGDIARMHFYFATRYEDDIPTYTASYDMIIKSSQQVYTDTFLSILLQWHTQDPVSQREIDRNDAIFAAQNNRNPFIDNPGYVNTIWGGGTADTQAPTTPTNLIASNPTATTVDLSWTASTDDTAVTNYDVYVGGSFYVSTNSTAITYTVTGLSPLTMYSFTVLAKDAANNMSAQSTSASETTLMGSGGGGGECASESFQNIPSTGGIPSSYTTRIWTGDNGLIWNATDARTDRTLNAEAITIRNGNLTSPSTSGGIGELTVTTQLSFTGSAGTFDLLVNGVSVGSVPYSGDNTTPTTTTVSNINITGDVIIVFDNQSTSNRVRIDDLSWTCFSGGSTDIQLAAKAYLQGAAFNRSFVSGEEDWMRDDLRVNSLIPTTSPYDATTCDPTVFNVVGSDAIVDWILVQLRDATDNTIITESQSALLQRDGDIVAVDGISNLSFTSAAGGYFIALKHRNHLGTITNTTATLSTTATAVDFTNSATVTFGTDAQTTFGMPTGVFAMWAGDANQDGRLNYLGALSDVPSIRSQVFNDANNSVFGGPPVATYLSAGYNPTDINLDGNTVYAGATSDVLYIRNNIFNNPSNSVFGGPPVATYVFTQQLPEGAN